MGITPDTNFDAMDYLYITGVSTSKEQAAIEFVKDLDRLFPKEQGLYCMYIRRPLDYTTEHMFDTGITLHKFFMRIGTQLEYKAKTYENETILGEL